MKRFALALLALAFSVTANAQTTLQQYQAGPRLIDGTQLNLMVNQVNNLTGNGTAGSTVKLTNGTVALPSLSFYSDTDTGIYRIGANNLGVAAAGAKVLDVATTGLGVTGVLTSGAHTITSASATSLTVGLTGATNPAFTVDSSTALQVAGLKITGAVHNGTVAIVVTDSSGAANLTINALSTGTIGIGSVSTGAVTITPATTISGAVTHSTTLLQTGVATFTNIPIFPATGVTIGSTTFSEATLALYTAGVASGYKIARGETALDGSNPTPVTTGLSTITGCSLTISTSSAPGVSTSVVTYTKSSGTMNMYGWKPTSSADTTLVASAGTDTIGWVCLGT